MEALMFRLVLTAMTGALFSALGSVPSAAAGPEPLYTVPGTFRMEAGSGGAKLELRDGEGAEIASYVLDGCAAGDAFSLPLSGSGEPIVAVLCNPQDGGQRFLVFAPARNRTSPILDITGSSFVRFAAFPGHVVLTRDVDGRIVEEIWRPVAANDESEVDWIREMLALAKGRKFQQSESSKDRDLKALAATLSNIATTRDEEALVALATPDILLSFGGDSGIESLRRLMATSWFWPAFLEAIGGGGALMGDVTDGRLASFPALFSEWPNDLDAFAHSVGVGSDAVLRAGPSENAPVLADLEDRIVVQGPYLLGDDRMRDDGWLSICLAEAGCGFARSHHVDSPIDWRAILWQERPGAPWEMRTFVAGD
jgi:hypothetical protein